MTQAFAEANVVVTQPQPAINVRATSYDHGTIVGTTAVTRISIAKTGSSGRSAPSPSAPRPLRAEDYPVLAKLWDNDDDAIYDQL